MERVILRFDEFAKRSFKRFMERNGFEVRTEVEIFKLPKKLDLLVVIAREQEIPRDFGLFRTYWKTYNLVSYKSPRDRLSQKDIHAAEIYLPGFVNMTRQASFANTTMTILANHSPKRILSKYKNFVNDIAAGQWQIDYNAFQIRVMDLNQIEVPGTHNLDSGFLMELADSPSFLHFLAACRT